MNRWSSVCPAGRVVLLVVAMTCQAWAAPPEAIRADPRWFEAPRSEPAAGFQAEGVRAVFFDGPTWRNSPTRVFAWVGVPQVEPGRKVPGIVLIHGGGGTAFDAWVRLWVKRGYAAIAMDTCGCVPKGTYSHWQRHDAGGPAGWGAFDSADEPREDQWPYHAVADAILAHSLLRSLPEVDPDRTGVTGISWGGYLTCIVSGLDPRFKFAAPVYGCGFLGDNSAWLAEFQKRGAKGERWLALWDPSRYLAAGTMPKLWVTGTNDFAYPLDSLQKSYRLAGGRSTLCVRLRMRHGHNGPGENPEEIHTFAESILNGKPPLATIVRQGAEGDRVHADFEAARPIARAELLFTKDTGVWKERKWDAIPAQVDAAAHRVHATLPPGTRVYFLNLIDDHDEVVSSEHVELDPSPSPAAK